MIFLLKNKGSKKTLYLVITKQSLEQQLITDVNTNKTGTKLIGEKEIDKNFITDEKIMFYQFVKDKDVQREKLRGRNGNPTQDYYWNRDRVKR